MYTQFIQQNIPQPLKFASRIYFLSVGTALIVNFVEAIIFSIKASEINQDELCTFQFSVTFQAISNYATLVYFILVMFGLVRNLRKTIFFVAITSFILKAISFISMLVVMDKAWGSCYIGRGQVGGFIMSDVFWIIFLLFFMIMVNKMRVQILLHCRGSEVTLKQLLN